MASYGVVVSVAVDVRVRVGVFVRVSVGVRVVATKSAGTVFAIPVGVRVGRRVAVAVLAVAGVTFRLPVLANGRGVGRFELTREVGLEFGTWAVALESEDHIGSNKKRTKTPSAARIASRNLIIKSSFS